MREILSRGLTTWKSDDNEFNHVWVNGDLIISNKKYYIHPQNNKVSVNNELGKLIIMHEVIPETIGQYTGLTDKNGKKIFEGDIIRHDVRMGAIQYYENFGMFMIYWIGGNGANMFVNIPHTEVEIIGNIHDNPELID